MPVRSIEDDRKKLFHRVGDNPSAICTLIFGGRDIFSGECRILVAGGGTGDSTLFFAKYLRDIGGNGRVVHLDQSAAANEIIATRLSRFDLNNVDIQERSLLDLDPQEDGLFDYINCNGVLHHLPSPVEGLHRLSSVTRPDGGLGIWTYAKYGRTGMYHVQRMILDLVGSRPVDADAIALTRDIFSELPSSSLGRYDGSGVLS
ncbi:class I SAM-dependent methyltransferase [Thalassobaculum sp.]|uniref:class I SAM-dependent methyltransferase n=1 Tax=Thalassobaculum sp. TaxID=2022740 RepID=UPI0032EFEDA1